MAALNNSFVSQDEASSTADSRPDFEERKKDMQQFSDARQIKKKPENAIWTWVRSMFFSGRSIKDILKAQGVDLRSLRGATKKRVVEAKHHEQKQKKAPTASTNGGVALQSRSRIP